MFCLTIFVQVLFLIVMISLLIDSRRKKYWKLILFLFLFIAVTASYYHLPRKMKVLDNNDLVASYRFYYISDNDNSINLLKEDNDYLIELLNNRKVTIASKSYVSTSQDMIMIDLYSLDNHRLMYTLHVNQITGQTHIRNFLVDRSYLLKGDDDFLDYIMLKNDEYVAVVSENPDIMKLNANISKINDTDKQNEYEIIIELPEDLQITEVYLYTFNYSGISSKLYIENRSEDNDTYEGNFELSDDVIKKLVKSRTKVYIRGFEVLRNNKEIFQDIVDFEL